MRRPTTREGTAAIEFPRRLDAARRGSRAAQEALFLQYYPQVERIVHAELRRDLGGRRPWLSARFSTRDVVQDVFCCLLRGLGAFNGSTEGEFVAYVVKLVRSRTLDVIRHHRAACRDYRRSSSSLEGAPSIAAPPAGEGAAAERADLQESLEAALASLPDATRRLLRGRIERGLGFEALAREFGYPSRYAARRAFFAAQARLAMRLRTRGSRPAT